MFRVCTRTRNPLSVLSKSHGPSYIKSTITIRTNHGTGSCRGYATYRDVRYKPASPFPWSRVLKPLTFTVLFTGVSFGAAWYVDFKSGYRPDADSKIKTLGSLIALNALVFAAHQVVPVSTSGLMSRLLRRYGTLHPSSAHLYPATVLTSGFSHAEVWHFGLNMVGLYTIGSAIFDVLGQTQFCAFYGTAICWSSMAQLLLGIGRARKGVVPRGSLGASGGIYALLGVVAWYAPTSSVYLIFLPFIPIQLGYAFTGMIAMDTVGLLRGWSTFGHAAHLTGGLGGLLYGVAQVPETWIAQRKANVKRYLSRWGR